MRDPQREAGDDDRTGQRPDTRNDDPAGGGDAGNLRDDKERWRLAWHYADMTDGELESLATDPGSLTEVARRALQSELRRRGFPVDFEQPAVAAVATAAKPERSRKLATLCRFRDVPEALLAKSVLESAGIECLLADANIIRTDWLWSNLVGGVKLRVLEEDLEEAASLLNQSAPELFAMQDPGDVQQPSCPRCHSAEVSMDDLHHPEVAAAFPAGDAPRAGNPAWTCQSCGNQWYELEPTG